MSIKEILTLDDKWSTCLVAYRERYFIEYLNICIIPVYTRITVKSLKYNNNNNNNNSILKKYDIKGY